MNIPKHKTNMEMMSINNDPWTEFIDGSPFSHVLLIILFKVEKLVEKLLSIMFINKIC